MKSINRSAQAASPQRPTDQELTESARGSRSVVREFLKTARAASPQRPTDQELTESARGSRSVVSELLRSTIVSAAMIAMPALAQEHRITQKDRAFSQTEISIKVGESVVFKNADEVTHNVFSVSPGMEFDIRRQAPGDSSTVTFSKEGVAEVRCSIHPKMKLLVTVKK